MKVYKIAPGDCIGDWHTFDNAKKAAEEIQMLLENSDVPGTIRVEIVEMPVEEYEALPEHQGF